MIHGIGVDIVAHARIEKMYARHGARLARRILSARELEEFRVTRKQPAHYLASAFAVKEAFVKALGTGFRGVTHRDPGVVRDELGKPSLIYSRALARRLKALGIGGGHVSLSDDGGMVCAYVILEKA
ncbi:MAG TPA: holo-ACP synthase [Nevskiaceae bacterium]|nr:holo-ACP synthase [Nevskiaceae bacterium]